MSPLSKKKENTPDIFFTIYKFIFINLSSTDYDGLKMAYALSLEPGSGTSSWEQCQGKPWYCAKQGNSVNDSIKVTRKSVHYCSVDDVAKSIVARQPLGNVWLTKVDLADAYRIAPIRIQGWKYQGICVQWEFYVNRMLPMGALSSCYIFQKICDSIKSMFYNVYSKDVDVFNYLDDFLFMGSSREACDAAFRA